MPPKRLQQNKTVTIYNSKASACANGNSGSSNVAGAGSSVDKKIRDDSQRNSLEAWLSHFKPKEIEDVKALINAKDVAGIPLMIGATALNKTDLILNLLKQGYNINETDKNNMTALLWSVKLKNMEMFHFLLLHKADPAVKQSNGDSLLFMALGSTLWEEEDFITLWNYLHDFTEIDVNAHNKNGLSMLHLAIRREWNHLVDILITNNANINITNPSGITPLMLASYRNDYNIVSRLISNGASVKRKTSDGFTALCYAFSSVILRNLPPPYIVVERLQDELAKKKIYLLDYLKDRLKIMLTPGKKISSEQPNAEQMLQHILTFIICNIDDGFDILWNQLEIAKYVKDAIEKNFEDKERLKLPLLTLNALVKNLPKCSNCCEHENSISQSLVNSGCFDACVNVMKKYDQEETLVFLAFTPIIMCKLSYDLFPKWLEDNCEIIDKYHNKFCDALTISGVCPSDYKMMPDKSGKMNQRISKAPVAVVEECAAARSNVQKAVIVETKTSKKSRKRAKALKAKAAEMAEQCSVSEKKSEPVKPPSFEEVLADDKEIDVEETLCVNAIKNALGILEEEDVIPSTSQSESSHKSRKSTTTVNSLKSDWKNVIYNLPFQSIPPVKLHKPTTHDGLKKQNAKTKQLDVDLTIKYLEELLELIVNKYKVMWDLDKSYKTEYENTDVDFSFPIFDTNMEAQQNMEKEKLRMVHKEFYNLTRNIKQMYEHDPETCTKLLQELEKHLLTHSIRGETIVDQVAAMEVVKVNVTMPTEFEHLLPKYMEKVINKEIEEFEDIKINSVEHVVPPKNIDHHSMGDYVYLNDISNYLYSNQSKHCDCSTASSVSSVNMPKSNEFLAYVNPIFNIGEENDDTVKTCCNKGCIKATEVVDNHESRWSLLLRSLELMDDCQSFISGKIRISNAEKRKSHVLSPSGNFAALEIGLGVDNIPVAVKMIPKNDNYAGMLKSQIDPILELRHKNVLHYYICAYDASFLVIATPLCEYNLGQFVLKMKHTQMNVCKVNIIRQILQGLLYLHDHDEPIVHGNLKPSNVLITLNGTVRIAEFGIHKALLKLKNLPESSIIWFATESYKVYKQNGPVECTCASDIQVAGMLVHFAMNSGAHPFGKCVPDILKNLEKASSQILSKDMELYDLLTWMLLGEPSERPTIHQVLSHIFFWSNQKKWRYILACAGVGQSSAIPMDIERLHASLDKTAHKENIMGNCWVLTVKKQFPNATFIEPNDTPSGLLKFIKHVVDNNIVLHEENDKSLNTFILTAFPYFALSLYRMIENTEWSDHRIFMPFHNVVDY